MTAYTCNLEQLQAYLDGECEPALAALLEAHLDTCQQCQDDLCALGEQEQWVHDSLALLHDAPMPDAMASLAEFEQKHKQRIDDLDAPRTDTIWERLGWLMRGMQWSGALAACAVLIWLLPIGEQHSIQKPAQSPTSGQNSAVKRGVVAPRVRPRPIDLVAKGFPLQMFHASYQFPTVAAAQPARQDQVVHPLDMIQFRYRMRQKAHVMVVGINDKKAVFPYVPLNGKGSQLVPSGEGRLPEKALELDETLGAEKFYMIIAHKPFAFSEVREVLLREWSQSKGQLRRIEMARKGWQVKSILVQKLAREKRPHPRHPR